MTTWRLMDEASEREYRFSVSDESDESVGIFDALRAEIESRPNGGAWVPLDDPDEAHEDYGVVEANSYWGCVQSAVERCLTHAQRMEYLIQAEAERKQFANANAVADGEWPPYASEY